MSAPRFVTAASHPRSAFRHGGSGYFSFDLRTHASLPFTDLTRDSYSFPRAVHHPRSPRGVRSRAVGCALARTGRRAAFTALSTRHAFACAWSPFHATPAAFCAASPRPFSPCASGALLTAWCVAAVCGTPYANRWSRGTPTGVQVRRCDSRRVRNCWRRAHHGCRHDTGPAVALGALRRAHEAALQTLSAVRAKDADAHEIAHVRAMRGLDQAGKTDRLPAHFGNPPMAVFRIDRRRIAPEDQIVQRLDFEPNRPITAVDLADFVTRRRGCPRNTTMFNKVGCRYCFGKGCLTHHHQRTVPIHVFGCCRCRGLTHQREQREVRPG